jgi:hypothetical protein
MNKMVVKLMNRLLIDLSKSRPRRHNDNALVETKNGGIIRKAMGYNHIPSVYAAQINAWYGDYFNTYLNYHRPCGFAVTTTDAKGKERKKYPTSGYMTPYRKLKCLENATQYLKPNITFEQLDAIEQKESDTDYAERMSKAKYAMLSEIERLENLARRGIATTNKTGPATDDRKASKEDADTTNAAEAADETRTSITTAKNVREKEKAKAVAEVCMT